MSIVKKALIPAAGFGTRLFPASKVFKKEFFPVIDRDGRAKPIVLKLVEEVLSAGIEEIGIIIQESDRELFEDFFYRPAPEELQRKLSPENREIDRYLVDLGRRIALIPQREQEGYGHAVYQGKDWVNGEPFLLTLGDHLYRSDSEISCSKQLMEAFESYRVSTMALTQMPEEILYKAGIVGGCWLEGAEILKIDRMEEKPTPEIARSVLRVDGLRENEYLGAFGLYILESVVFERLEAQISTNQRYKGEFQLTTALDALASEGKLLGRVMRGRYLDTGMPDFYRQTIVDFRS
ncbi:sugar phosphate nucleotidyltransferase [Pannus brasiliensis CCIBt3594]|uniref:UTP--glucose-1-phosphate uridylyltransferase n=1 Tax=Pannus brasiliensis CCIBt3594 TaxID=1427578 RepID=A0AAW9QWC3_9CHRO